MKYHRENNTEIYQNILQSMRNWRKKNKELVTEYRKYYWRNKADKDAKNLARKEKRHALGISKKFINRLNVPRTDEYKKLYNQKTKALSKYPGDITVKTIQLVYEDNIKKYGTLTCYLCRQPIEFGNDNLEHKTPASKGGTNDYNNLAISCKSCNCRKHTKTLEEYLEISKQEV
jgi:5-methylcytosine-specific restriction endonuclease McrA